VVRGKKEGPGQENKVGNAQFCHWIRGKEARTKTSPLEEQRLLRLCMLSDTENTQSCIRADYGKGGEVCKHT